MPTGIEIRIKKKNPSSAEFGQIWTFDVVRPIGTSAFGSAKRCHLVGRPFSSAWSMPSLITCFSGRRRFLYLDEVRRSPPWPPCGFFLLIPVVVASSKRQRYWVPASGVVDRRSTGEASSTIPDANQNPASPTPTSVICENKGWAHGTGLFLCREHGEFWAPVPEWMFLSSHQTRPLLITFSIQ